MHNISNVAHQAVTTTAALASIGYHAIDAGQAPVPATTVETVLRYHPGSIADAETIMASLNGSVIMQPDPAVAAGTVNLDAGTTLAVNAAPAAPATTTTTTTTTRSPRPLPLATTTVPGARTIQAAPWNSAACAAGQPVNGR